MSWFRRRPPDALLVVAGVSISLGIIAWMILDGPYALLIAILALPVAHRLVDRGFFGSVGDWKVAGKGTECGGDVPDQLAADQPDEDR
jgi:hypothetical protein